MTLVCLIIFHRGHITFLTSVLSLLVFKRGLAIASALQVESIQEEALFDKFFGRPGERSK